MTCGDVNAILVATDDLMVQSKGGMSRFQRLKDFDISGQKHLHAQIKRFWPKSFPKFSDDLSKTLEQLAKRARLS